MITEKICNAVRMDIEGVSQTGLPLDGFPQEFQTLVLDLVKENTYNLEFLVTSFLSAISTALGNSLRIHIKGNWKSNVSLFFLIVGRAGLGKTPPLAFAFAPIEALDKKIFLEYKEELARNVPSKSEKTALDTKSSICKTILKDFTPEALMLRHSVNLHGIVIKVDELRGFFKKVKNPGDDTIEKLLTAWSNEALSRDLKTEALPTYIEFPCVNLIGCVQIRLLSDTMTEEMVANGFFDRCIFCYPKNQKQNEWDEEEESCYLSKNRPNKDRWFSIIDKVFSLSNYKSWKEFNVEDAKTLEFSSEGRRLFFRWVNTYIRKNNAIEDESQIPTRDAKLSTHCARLALIMQVLRWACGESHLEYVDEISVNQAIRLVSYYEECYSRMLAKTVKEEVPDEDAWLDELGQTFSAKELKQVCSMFGMPYRTIYDHVKRLLTLPNPPIRRLAKGKYEKVQVQKSSAQSAHCTTAQKEPTVDISMASDDVCADSADVHCADERFDPHNEESNNENEPGNE